MATSSDTTESLPSGALHPIASTRLTGAKGRPDMVAIGVIIWLASELMFFAALFAAYFTVRSVTNAATGGELWGRNVAMLNVPVAAAISGILVASSITCQMGVFAAERGDVKKLRMWYIITFIMGTVFVGGQAFEYAMLYQEGITPQTDVWASLFFLATGFHGLHVIGGLIAFLFVLARTYLARRFTHEQAVSAVAISYYWHFVDVVWIVLWATIYIIR